jgi:hypothetical protein
MPDLLFFLFYELRKLTMSCGKTSTAQTYHKVNCQLAFLLT